MHFLKIYVCVLIRISQQSVPKRFIYKKVSVVSGSGWRPYTWQTSTMMTSSNGNIFRVTGHLCGEFTGPRWIPRTKASDAELGVFFDLRLNKIFSKQSWGWWFETPSRPLWRHRNALTDYDPLKRRIYASHGNGKRHRMQENITA